MKVSVFRSVFKFPIILSSYQALVPELPMYTAKKQLASRQFYFIIFTNLKGRIDTFVAFVAERSSVRHESVVYNIQTGQTNFCGLLIAYTWQARLGLCQVAI
jgi:hypothetical protein